MSERWIQRGAAVTLDHLDAVTILGRDGKGRRFTDASADVIRVALDFFSAPHTEDELLAHLRELAGACDPALVADVVTSLREAGALSPFVAGEEVASRAPAPPRARVLVGVSGAIAATDVPLFVRLLQARRFDVAVVLTAAARRFVSTRSLEAITHRPVYGRFWQARGRGPAPHIELAAWADVVVLYPASAATIARVASAACTDVLSAAVTATSAPVLVVPSMNESMYLAPAVRRNLEQLRRDGRHLLSASLGLEVATAPSARTPMLGAAPPPAQVVAAIELLLSGVPRRPLAAPAKVTAEDWDRQYGAAATAAELPWFTQELDADLANELREIARGRLLDVGTGPGTAAIFAAKNGFEVVATDISAVALSVARRRAGELPIAWVLDDILRSCLWGRFDVALDRGCLHVLPREAWPKYAETMRARLGAGGRLLLKVHAPEEGTPLTPITPLTRLGTSPASAEDLAALFGAHFSLVRVVPSVFAGTLVPSPKALFAVLERTAEA